MSDSYSEAGMNVPISLVSHTFVFTPAAQAPEQSTGQVLAARALEQATGQALPG